MLKWTENLTECKEYGGCPEDTVGEQGRELERQKAEEGKHGWRTKRRGERQCIQ